MSRLSRLVLAASLTALAAAAPAQAYQKPDCVREPCYQCVMYPCGPGDWVEYLSGGAGGLVGVEIQGPVVCVTEPCDQPMPVVVCVAHQLVCTPR